MRQRYTPEFKREAARLMIIDGESAPKVSEKLGVNTGMLHKWKREHLAELDGSSAPRVGASPTQMAAEIDQLRKRLAKGSESTTSRKYGKLLRQGNLSRFEHMKRHQRSPGLADMSEALGVSSGGYYRWREARPSARRQQDEQIKPQISQIWRQCPGPYGNRPVHAHLTEEGVACCRDRTLRLMRELGLVGHPQSRFKPIGTDSNHLFGYHSNMLRKLGKLEYRDQVWVVDTTFLLSDSGWYYLATIMDLCTRRIVGWSVSDRNDSKLICTALENAALTRGEVREGIVHHSDRGSTYASDCYQRLLRRLKMHPT